MALLEKSSIGSQVYLFFRKQTVCYQNFNSEDSSVLNGVPEGSVLGPLMFIIFINDLPDVIKHSRVIKYADDTVFYFSNRDFTVIERSLTEDMTVLAKWLDDNDLVANLKKGKTESM